MVKNSDNIERFEYYIRYVCFKYRFMYIIGLINVYYYELYFLVYWVYIKVKLYVCFYV